MISIAALRYTNDNSWVDACIDSYASGTLISHLAFHRVDVFLVKSGDPTDRTLSDHSEWAAAYRDQQAVVYLPLIGPQREMVTGQAEQPDERAIFPGECGLN